MRRVTVLAVGKLKESYLRQAVAEYSKRLSRYTQFQVVEIPESKLPNNPSPAQIAAGLEKEGEKILSLVPPQAERVALCIEGDMLDSPQLAQRLRRMENTSSHVVFIIGSSHGLADCVKNSCPWQLSLSPMTFPHQLTRVLLAEQIYRAFAINQGIKYHK